ncbi:hypothetical protein [Namhaeicola litoreus]|uniref:Uncharacterized protein n=1 Tax=Namhaeicola litoreus TaxID=1052145 RepID=A0ABW3Y3P6_9FLAO
MSEIKKAEVFIPKGSKVYLFTNETLYYYTPYFSANRLKLGYSFPKGRTIDYIIESIEPNSYTIMSSEQYASMLNKFSQQFEFLGSDDKNTYLKKV